MCTAERRSRQNVFFPRVRAFVRGPLEKNGKEPDMKRLMLATVAGAALLAGATAANAQYYNDGYYGSRGPFVERGVGLQVGPLGIGVYDNSPTWNDGYSYRHSRQPRDNSVYESNSFRANQWYPQSPPGGGY
jgi:hypothetical protein